MEKQIEVATGRVGLPTLPQTFEQVEAQRKFNRFQAQTKDEYFAKITAMTNFDLSNHATTVGVRPGSDRSRTQKALLVAFDNAKAAANKNYGLGSVERTEINAQIKDSYQEFLDSFKASKLAS